MIDQLQIWTRTIAHELSTLRNVRIFEEQERTRLEVCLAKLAEATDMAEDQRRGLGLHAGVLNGNRGIRATPQGLAHMEYTERTLAQWDDLLGELKGSLFIEGHLLRAKFMAEGGRGETALESLGKVLAKAPDHAEATLLLDHPALPRMGVKLLKAKYCLTLLATVGVPKARYLSDIAVMPEQGRVFIADTKNDAVHMFDMSGNALMSITQGLKSPYGLCDAGAGLLMVCDMANSRIVFLDCQGNELRSLNIMDITRGVNGPLLPSFACPCGPDVYFCCSTPQGMEYLFVLRPCGDGYESIMLDIGPIRQITGLHHANGRLFVLSGKQQAVFVLNVEMKNAFKLIKTKKFADIPVKLRSLNSNFFLATHEKLYKLDKKLDTIYSVPIPTRPYNNQSSAFARIDLCHSASIDHLYIVDDMQKGYSVFKV